jgi:hypothetical protein
MKEVLATFAIGVLCFVAFVTTVKQTAIDAVQWTNKPDYCLTELSSVRRCGSPCRSLRRHRRTVTARRCYD